MYQENDYFHFEEWLKSRTYWEDMDTALVLIATEDGGVSIMDYGCSYEGSGPDLVSACKDYDSKIPEGRLERG